MESKGGFISLPPNGVYLVLGLMSGTSLDGMDIALSRFKEEDGRWSFGIVDAVTIPFPTDLKSSLAGCHTYSGLDLLRLHTHFGRETGRMVLKFLEGQVEQPHLIAFHGQTVFHSPVEGFTLQIGDGSQIAAMTRIPVVCQFRNLDVALGGQGAPLVPLGDALLFSEWDACLNIGGFANISLDQSGKRIAFDICPANYILNRVVSDLGFEYDKGGQIASRGMLIPALLDELNRLPFYSALPPKSLGREWVEENFFPILNHYHESVPDLLRTLSEHIAFQIAQVLNGFSTRRLLVTGGGAYHTFLLDRIASQTEARICVPESGIIDFKEALVFGFLGLLRFLGRPNCLQSVTGAARDHSGGVIYRI